MPFDQDGSLPLAKLSNDWLIGPYHMQIKGRDQGMFFCEKGHDPLRDGWPGLWHHDADRDTALKVLADAQLSLRTGRGLSQARQMLARGSRLQLALEVRHTSQRLAACLTPEPMLGIRSWASLRPKADRRGVQEMMCLWLNSTVGLFLRLAHAHRPYPGRSALTHTSAAELQVLDVSALPGSALREAARAFRQLRPDRLLPIYRLGEDPLRQLIDETVAAVLGLSIDRIGRLAKALSNEPNVRALKDDGGVAS